MKSRKQISIETILLTLLIMAPLYPGGPLLAQEPTDSAKTGTDKAAEKAPETNQKDTHKEFEIGDSQAVDVYGSLEDGTPGGPGENEVIVSAGWMNSREARNTFGGGIEFGHTFSGSQFFENMQLGLGIEGERADMMNESRLSYQNLSWFLTGRQQAGGNINNLAAQLNDFLLSRNLVDSFYHEDLRPLGYYQAGQILNVPPTGALITINQSTILDYQKDRLILDPRSGAEISESYRLQTKKRKSESSGEIAPSWLQR